MRFKATWFLSLFFILLKLNHVESNFPQFCGLKFIDRIVGGTDSLANAWPWMASIHYNYKHICGASLINDQWLLTAAHCIHTASAYKILLGAHNISNVGLDTNAVRYGVEKIIKNEKFTQTKTYDIALIKLQKKVAYSYKIWPVCVPIQSDDFSNATAVYPGWGYTYPNGNVQLTLRETNLATLTNEECKLYSEPESKQKYCSGAFDSLQDTCQGDSGGPMLVQKDNLRWHIAGIVSYGKGDCGSLGVNARVDFFRDWIENTMANN